MQINAIAAAAEAAGDLILPSEDEEPEDEATPPIVDQETADRFYEYLQTEEIQKTDETDQNEYL